jgi:hypothetical protein
MRRLFSGITVVLCLYVPATAELFKIDNPASNIYNPATRMDNPNPISPPTQPVPHPEMTAVTPTSKPTAQIKEQTQPQHQPNHNIPHKSYHFKTAIEYIDAIKMNFKRENYKKALSITEDALRRIRTGTLKASKKTKQKLNEYKVSGYKLMNKTKDKELNK